VKFSSKFASSAKEAPFLSDPTVIKAEPGSHPVAVAEDGVDAYALTHNETSTGVSMPIIRPASIGDALVLVDATSAAGGLDLDITQSDVYYFAPQKSFASDGGLWIAIMSPAAIARVAKIKESGRWIPAFFDLQIAIDNLSPISDLQHTCSRDLNLARRADRVDEPERWLEVLLLVAALTHHHVSTTGLKRPLTQRHLLPTLRCAQRLLEQSTSMIQSMPLKLRRSSGPMASLILIHIASSVRTNSESECSLQSIHRHIDALTACIDYVVGAMAKVVSYKVRRIVTPAVLLGVSLLVLIKRN
jgi:hypothetical protein